MSLNQYMDPEDNDRSTVAYSSLSHPLLDDDVDTRLDPSSSSSSFNDRVGSLGFVRGGGSRGNGMADDDEDDEDVPAASRGGSGIGDVPSSSRRGVPTIIIIVATLAFFLALLFLSAALVPRSPGGGKTQSSSSSSSSSSTSSSDDPHGTIAGVHLGLTGRGPTEMYVQFATSTPGLPVVEYYAKGGTAATATTTDAKGDASNAGGGGWTVVDAGKNGGDGRIRVDGHSVTYDSSDMCQEPATSIGPGRFSSPGYLHTVRLINLDTDTTYAYRVGVAVERGVVWDDGGGYEFRTSSDSSSSSVVVTDGDDDLGVVNPTTTFLALADMGCWDTPPSSTSSSVYDNDDGRYDDDDDDDDGAREGGMARITIAGHDGEGGSVRVADLIASMVDEGAIDSIHIFGDLSYADGDGRLWDAWFELIRPFASRVPVMVGVGNHEYDHTMGGGGGKDPSGISTDYGFSPSWGGGSFDNTGGECGVPISRRFSVPNNGNGVFWYSYDQPLLHTVMLSTEHDMAMGSSQYVWLEKDLGAVDRSITPWVVVEMHRPMYNPELHGWTGAIVSEGLQNEVEDLLVKSKVDLVLNGHYHSYFRSCDGLYFYECDNGGPTYITIGTGGAPLDGESSMIPNDYTEYFDKKHWGVGRASVLNATAMHWEFVAVGGEIMDEVWLTRDR